MRPLSKGSGRRGPTSPRESWPRATCSTSSRPILRDHADVALGKIQLEWGLFEGGKRVGELRAADAKVRSNAAEAESVADLIAFQVNEAYRVTVAARKGIDLARPAVDQARESYRLVCARYKEGEAIPSDLIEAQTAPVRR